MNALKSFVLFFLICLASTQAIAQTDTEFWFGAPAITATHADRPIVLRLSSYALAATVTISEPANASFTPIVVNLNAYSAQTIDLTNFIGIIESEPHNIVLNYGLKISATNAISAYYEMQGKTTAGTYNNPEIFALKGNTSKGLNFMIPGQLQYDNRALATPAHNGFVIVATEDNTSIDITPSKDAYGHSANMKFNIVLNKGQSYSVIANSTIGSLHLVGSIVTATKPICITVYDDSIGPPNSNYDLVGDQIIPEDANGQEFILVRGEMAVGNTGAFDYYNILATSNNTNVYLDGATTPIATLNRGAVYTGKLSNSSAYIKTSNPVYINQLTGIGNEMAFTDLPSIRCTGSSVVSFARSINTAFYLNLLCKSADIGRFLLNGTANIITSSMFSPVPGTNGEWMYSRISSSNLATIDNLIQTGATTVVTNTSGLFHLGFLNGSASSGAELGYFSNYSRTTLSPIVGGLQCTGNDINLLATNVIGATYQWTGPNGFSSNIYNPSISNINPSYSGYYVVSANILGCGSFIDSTLVTVNPVPTISISTGDSICVGKSKTLALNFSGTAPFVFSYSDGLKTDTISGIPLSNYSLKLSPIVTTTYAVKYVTDANSCTVNASNNILNIATTVKVNPNPSVGFVMPLKVCTPMGAANFLDTSKIADGTALKFTYRWNFGDGGIDSIKAPVHNYTTPTNQSVQLIVSSIDGCVDSLTKTLPVYATPVADFSITPVYCLRDSLQIKEQSNANGNTITRWYWRFANGITNTKQTPSYTYLNSGNQNIQLVVETDKACVSDTLTKSVLINPLPIANFTTSTKHCENAAINFLDASIANAGNLKRWNWNFVDGTKKDTISGAPFYKTYTDWNTYPVRLMVESDNGCKSDTVVLPVIIHAQPHVGFILPEVCLDDAVAIFIDTTTIADGSNAIAYQWNYNASTPAITPIPTITSLTTKNGSAHYNISANYKVTYKVTTSFGCDSLLTRDFTVNGSTPHANFVVLNDTKLCSNDSIRIYDSSYVDFGIITKNNIYWNYVSTASIDSVDDNTLFKKQYPHLYPDFQTPATKTYQIRMTARSGNSSVCSNTITKTITIHQSPKVQFTTLPGICNDTTARQITQAKELGGVPGVFVYTGSGTSATGLYTPNGQIPGTYPIKYFYSTSFGCADSATKPITVWPSPVAKWGVNAILCEKNNIQFTDSSVANYSSIVQRYWDFGDGTNILYTNSAPFTKQYASGNTYATSLRVVTDSGCRSTYNIRNLKLNFLPVVNFTLPSICLPDGNGLFKNISTIKDNSEGLFTYLWNFGDPNDPSASTLKQPTHKYTALGPVNVQLKITSKDLCIDSLTQILASIYPQPKANFVANPTEICLNDQINFIDNSDGKTSAMNTWYWDLANGTSSGVQNPIKQFTDSGSFKISLYAYNQQGCVSDTMVKTVIVHPYPKLILGPNLKVLEFGMTLIKPKYVYGTALSYLWTPATDLSSDTAKVPICKPKADITYKLTLTGIGNCSVSDTIFVKVLLAPVVPNVFSPNGDGINDTWKIEYLESYPGATIDVFNRYGQKVYSSLGYDKEWDGTYNGNPLPVGTYYYIVNPKNGRALISGSVTIIK